MQGKTVWIVDAINPLGNALATALNKQGNFVIASGRDAEALAALSRDSGGAIAAMHLDLEDEASVGAAKEQLATLSDRLDVVVANVVANVVTNVGANQNALRERSVGGSIDAELCGRQMNSNYLAMVKTLEMAMPLLRRSRAPYIVCAGSAVARLPLAGIEAFGASAAATEYFARALALELKEQNIALSIVRAGVVAGSSAGTNDWAARFAVSAEEAAQRLMVGMEGRKRLIHLPRTLGWLLAFVDFLPVAWVRGIVAQLNRQSGVTW